MKKHNLPNVTEVHILGINISALLLNVTTIKSDDSDKANIQIIKKNTQVIDIKIKKVDIDHFHEHANSLTIVMAVHSAVIPDQLNPLFKACNFSRIVISGINSHKLSSK